MKQDTGTEVVTSDLRKLIFWAAVGVTSSVGGSYENEIVDIIESYAETIEMQRGSFATFPVRFKTPEKFAAEKLGSKGGKASAAKLTPLQRKQRATKASHSRKSPLNKEI